MEMMSIGDFARETRLSQKALRLYDELGLLPPARVDPVSGYRLYVPAQLEKARLVAMLRQIGMSLSDIKVSVGLDAPAAALRLERYWSGVEQDHASRRALTSYLVNRLIGKRTDMYEVATRKMPERSLLCLKRRVRRAPGLWARNSWAS
jgi:protein phosphatase